MWRSSPVGPLELELELLLVPLPLVLDVELGTGGHVDSLPGHLYLEALTRLQSVGQPSKLRYKLGGGVDLLDVSVWLFAHQCSLGSLNCRPLVSYRVRGAEPSDLEGAGASLRWAIF